MHGHESEKITEYNQDPGKKQNHPFQDGIILQTYFNCYDHTKTQIKTFYCLRF